MKISNTGYKNNSKDKKEKSLVIPSNKITMKNVPHNVLGVDNLGNSQMMYPDNNYSFPGDYVTEYPMMQNGGQYLSPAKWNQLQMQNGMMASPGYSTNTVKSNKSYLEFYDPNQFMPVPDGSGAIGWNKIGDPTYKYTNESNSPFIKYTPPKQQVTQQKTYLNANSGRTAIGFDTNYTTYKYDDGSIKMFDKQGLEIQPLQKKMGGSLNKFMTNYLKQFGGAAGSEQIQGQSIDQFLEEKNNKFVDFLADNASKFLYRDEAKSFMQNGGQFNNGPFGAYADSGVPDYVTSINSQFNNPTAQDNSNGQYQFAMTQNGIDPNQVSYDTDMQNRMRELNPSMENQPNNNVNTSNIADLSMAGVQTLNNFFNKAESYKQKKWLDQQQAISNTSPIFYGNQGNYDVNQGKIKPNQTTPTYKKGGEYKMSKKEINDLIAAGYNIEFLD